MIRKSEGAAPLYIIIRESSVMARTFVGHRGSASVFLVSVCKRGRRGGRLSGPLWCQAPSRILAGGIGAGGGRHIKRPIKRQAHNASNEKVFFLFSGPGQGSRARK